MMTYIQKPKSLFEIRCSKYEIRNIMRFEKRMYVRDSISILTDKIIYLTKGPGATSLT